jgi:acyl carrier protein
MEEGLVSTDEIHARVRRVLGTLDVLRVDPSALADGDDLYAAGLRSLGAVRLLVALEGEFGVEFPESALHRGAFSTIAGIGAALGALAGDAALRPVDRG